jgi:aminopeptidase N
MFDDRVYLRGALTMHALRRHLGDGAFFEFLREWTDTHRHGLVDTAAFTALATARSPAAVDLLTAWLHNPALPPLPR